MSFKHIDMSINNRKNSKIYWFYDVPHLIKLLRNHFLDQGYQLPGQGNAPGITIGRSMLEKIYSKLKDCEVRVGYKLTPKHLYCKQQDRANVKLATQLFSKSTACAIKLLEPRNKKFIALASFIEQLDEWFDVMNSNMKYDRKDLRCGFRVYLQKQMKVLESASKLINEIRAIGHSKLLPCQVGFLISTKALPLLYEVFHNNVRTE
jgi:hypothetical protein